MLCSGEAHVILHLYVSTPNRFCSVICTCLRDRLLGCTQIFFSAESESDPCEPYFCGQNSRGGGIKAATRDAGLLPDPLPSYVRVSVLPMPILVLSSSRNFMLPTPHVKAVRLEPFFIKTDILPVSIARFKVFAEISRLAEQTRSRSAA